jgi:hypothetical protein
MRDETALQALDEPGAERVEPFELGEVDIDGARAAVAAGRFLDDDLEVGRVLGRPGADGGEREAFAVGRAGQRGGAQGFSLQAGQGARRRARSQIP